MTTWTERSYAAESHGTESRGIVSFEVSYAACSESRPWLRLGPDGR